VRGKVLSVFTGEFSRADVATVEGHIVGVGRPTARNSMDVADAHTRTATLMGTLPRRKLSKLTVDELASRHTFQWEPRRWSWDPYELDECPTLGVEYLLASRTTARCIRDDASSASP